MRRLLTLLGLLAVASAARWGLDPRAKSSWRPSTKIGGGPQRFGKEHFFRFDGTGVTANTGGTDMFPHGQWWD